MSRHLLVTSVLLVSLLGGMSACGGGDDEPDSKPKASKTAAATPTPKAQPQGADGVTYEIQNWDKYADDPVVLAYKTTNEAIGASINGSTILPAMREGLSKRGLRTYVPSLDMAKKRKFHVLPLGKVKISSVTTKGSSARLVVCAWVPSVNYYDKNGKAVDNAAKKWLKQNIGMRSRSGTWVLDTIKFSGNCKGGAPA